MEHSHIVVVFFIFFPLFRAPQIPRANISSDELMLAVASHCTCLLDMSGT